MENYYNKFLKETIYDLDSLKSTQKLSIEAKKSLLSIAVKQKTKPEKFLWNIGDSGEFAALIVKGFFEITRLSTSDEETVMGIFGPGDVIGMSAVLKKNQYPGLARCISKENEVIKLFLRPLLQKKGQESEEIFTWIREVLLVHEQTLRDKIDILNASSAEAKVLEFLKQMIRRFGVAENQVTYYIHLPLTKTLTAKISGIRVETSIRLIQKWQKQKLLTWNKDMIVIHNLPLLEKSVFSLGIKK